LLIQQFSRSGDAVAALKQFLLLRPGRFEERIDAPRLLPLGDIGQT